MILQPWYSNVPEARLVSKARCPFAMDVKNMGDADIGKSNVTRYQELGIWFVFPLVQQLMYWVELRACSGHVRRLRLFCSVHVRKQGQKKTRSTPAAYWLFALPLSWEHGASRWKCILFGYCWSWRMTEADERDVDCRWFTLQKWEDWLTGCIIASYCSRVIISCYCFRLYSTILQRVMDNI